MNIITVVGARPQFIKAAVVSRVLRAEPNVREILIHTGQHYDENMSQVFFDEMHIPKPDYDLGIGSAPHGVQTGRMLEEIEAILLQFPADCLLVYGDTNSTLAGALAAAKLHIPVAHVEAGLRSFNRRMPEEINRVLTDHVADLLFTPTQSAVENLHNEGIADTKICQVGDVMFDAVRYYQNKAESTSSVLTKLPVSPEAYILTTVHRAENTDDSQRLKAIVDGLTAIAQHIPVVLPLHPRTRVALQREKLMSKMQPPFYIIPPVGYLDMIMLEKHANLIITDSGGVQKEAFFHRVPCVTLRDETEWVELVESGWNRVCPPLSAITIEQTVLQSLGKLGNDVNYYGDGQAGQHIVAELLVRSSI